MINAPSICSTLERVIQMVGQNTERKRNFPELCTLDAAGREGIRPDFSRFW
jgi:hypothetical protein